MLRYPPQSHTYLLRFWKETNWRFMLENPHSGDKKGFESCEELMTFLEGELEKHPEQAREKELGT